MVRMLRGAAPVFCLAVLLLPGVLAQPEAPSSARFDYVWGAAIFGASHGHLDVLYADVAPAQGEALALSDVVAQLEIVRTRYNTTAIDDRPSPLDQSDLRQQSRWIPISGPTVSINGAQDPYLGLHGPGFPRDTGTTSAARFAEGRVALSPAQPLAPGESFWYAGEQGPEYHPAALRVAQRTAALDAPMGATFTEAFVVHIRNATIHHEDGAERLPPHIVRSHQGIDVLETVRHTEITITEAFLHVSAGTLQLVSDSAKLAVTDMAVDVEGDAFFHGADGTYNVGGSTHSISASSIGLRGDFRLHDFIADKEHDDPTRPESKARATGSFAVLHEDYTVGASRGPDASLAEKAVWTTLVVAVLTWFAWLTQSTWLPLFSRLEGSNALAHPKRRAIMDYVNAHPGCHHLQVARALGIARGVTRHHVAILERSGLLRRVPDGRFARLVSHTHAAEDALRAAVTDEPYVRTIRSAVSTGPVLRKELVALLRRRHGIADPTARRWIARAVKVGWLHASGRGHRVTYAHRDRSAAANGA